MEWMEYEWWRSSDEVVDDTLWNLFTRSLTTLLVFKQLGRKKEKRDIHESKRNSNNKKTVKNWKDTKAHDYGAQHIIDTCMHTLKKKDTQYAQQQQSWKNKKQASSLLWRTMWFGLLWLMIITMMMVTIQNQTTRAYFSSKKSCCTSTKGEAAFLFLCLMASFFWKIISANKTPLLFVQNSYNECDHTRHIIITLFQSIYTN